MENATVVEISATCLFRRRLLHASQDPERLAMLAQLAAKTSAWR